MRSTTYSEMINKPAPWRRAKNGFTEFLDNLYRTFAPRNKYGLTGRQMAVTLKIASNGAAGIVLAQVYACTGCGIDEASFLSLIAEHEDSLRREELAN